MIAEATRLTRTTIFQILKQSGRLGDAFKNSRDFMDKVIAELNSALNSRIIDGIRYEQIPSGTPHAEWDMSLFAEEEIIDAEHAITATKSLYEFVPFACNTKPPAEPTVPVAPTDSVSEPIPPT